MKHVVRPVWIALEGTIVPADVKERCRKSFKHIRRYFLKEVGKTFQVAELEIIQTHLTAEHFQEHRSEYVPLLVSFFGGMMGWGYRKHSSNKDIFVFNLFAFLKQTINADHTQAWVIFIPAAEKGPTWGTASAAHTYPGGCAVISTHFLAKEYTSKDYPSSFVHTWDGSTWGSGERVEGLIAHELSHVFGLDDNLEAVHRLMGFRDRFLRNCSLNNREAWILSRSPFLTEEEL